MSKQWWKKLRKKWKKLLLALKWNVFIPNGTLNLVYFVLGTHSKVFFMKFRLEKLFFARNWDIFVLNLTQNLVYLVLGVHSKEFSGICHNTTVLLYVNKDGNGEKFEKTLWPQNRTFLFQIWRKTFFTVFSGPTERFFFEILHNDRGLYVIKGGNSEYYEKSHFGPQIVHIYPKLDSKPHIVHLVLQICSKDFFEIFSSERTL